MNYLYKTRSLLQLICVIVIIFLGYSIFRTSQMKTVRLAQILSNSEVLFIKNLLVESNITQSVITEITIDDSIGCYFSKDNVMKDITETNLSKTKSIFFVDTSCNSAANEKIVIEINQACAIETAALTNVNYNVYVLYLSPGQIKDSGTVSDNLLKILGKYSNVKILHLNFQKLMDSMSIIHLYHNTLYSSYESTRAVIKFLILKKYGGIYLDNDVFVIKSFDSLPLNFIGTNASNIINGAVIGWRDQHSTNTINTDSSILEKTLETMVCNTNKSKCDNFRVFNKLYFYPVNKENWEVFFKDNKENENYFKMIVDSSYAVKMYLNKNWSMSSNPGTIYNRLASKYCPNVFNEIKNIFK